MYSSKSTNKYGVISGRLKCYAIKLLVLIAEEIGAK